MPARHDAHAARAQDEFARLAAEWRTGRPRGVDVAQMTKHPAYARIIKMGPTAIPLILQELDREVDHWFPPYTRLPAPTLFLRAAWAISLPWPKHGWIGEEEKDTSIRLMWIDDDLPGLDYEITSERDDSYNCIAWAAGYDNRWWSTTLDTTG